MNLSSFKQTPLSLVKTVHQLIKQLAIAAMDSSQSSQIP